MEKSSSKRRMSKPLYINSILRVPGLHVGYIVAFSIVGAVTLTVLALYVETIVFFFINLYNWKPKDKAKWVLAIYPVQQRFLNPFLES